MDTAIKLLQQKPLHIHDDSAYMLEQLYQPFAWGDTFLREVNRDTTKNILHIWPMSHTLILGMLDRRLPHCNDAIKVVRTQGYRAVVRNVGGLAVVADEGILNFSFILPKQQDEKMSITYVYEMMYAFVQYMFQQYNKTIQHFQIDDSYCPGDFDLSIDGKKFAGIAQRRFKNGVMVSIYLSVCGNQKKRGELVKMFYEKGLNGEKISFRFPNVNPSAMSNLSDLLGESLSVSSVKQLLLDTLEQLYVDYQMLEITQAMSKEYRLFYDKMIERNRKV